jgi:dTDP-4-dehydrorhamnose reductase
MEPKTMTSVVVLGGTGMLGSMVTDLLSREPGFALTATVRTRALADYGRKILPSVRWRIFDATRASHDELREVLAGARWAINAIGIIKPYAHDDNPSEVENAVRVNALFPCELAAAAGQIGVRVLQIATDCVFSGKQGPYRETAPHDAIDVYGKTKSLGEVPWPGFYCLRCSIVGPEFKAFASLLEWFRHQNTGATVTGFTNHQWNGVTTLHFAALCAGIIKQDLPLEHLQHVIPAGAISKHEMLQLFRNEFQRTDIEVAPAEAGVRIDRTLDTVDACRNQGLWAVAGYPEPPSVPQMIAELARFDYRFQETGA